MVTVADRECAIHVEFQCLLHVGPRHSIAHNEMSAAADLHRVTIIQRTSAIRTRSSKAAGLSPAILGHRCELLIGFI